ncbi:MAG: hypothetical protein B9S32_02655 [Verrucomicrobia bacterium Tous-C9LFEB]|nr:MAG: hypothetical protein B9S32_02655 [Verrucomicrobia bacterium Tous-C9LFEB]
METENPKPQTGGLKLMTVFIVVLALHVVVIGGISAYHIFKRGTGDGAGDISKQDTNTENADPVKPEAGPEPLQADGTPAPTPTDAQVTENVTAPQPTAQQSTGATAHNPTVSTQPPVVEPVATAVPAQPKTSVENTVKTSQMEVTVNKGDSLYKIARQNHMTVDAIKKLNGLASDNLKIGQKLKVEVKGAAPAPVTAPAQTAVASIKTTPVAPKVSAPVAAASSVYTVSKGDTLTKIAKQFKTTPSAIMSANNMTDPRKLSIGAKLKIPGQQATTQPVAAPEKAASAKPAPAQSSDLVMAR